GESANNKEASIVQFAVAYSHIEKPCRLYGIRWSSCYANGCTRFHPMEWDKSPTGLCLAILPRQTVLPKAVAPITATAQWHGRQPDQTDHRRKVCSKTPMPPCRLLANQRFLRLYIRCFGDRKSTR